MVLRHEGARGRRRHQRACADRRGVTNGNVDDAKLMDRSIRDDDTAVDGDKGYASGARSAPRRRRACFGR